MKIPLSCMLCSDCANYPAELQDDGLYKFICENGHEIIVCLQEQKFELLFDLAANAMIDGYYREAVSSFTSSAERFYEFYIKVISIKHGVSEKSIVESWKKISSQSERQLGAYIFLYTIENGSTPPLLSSKITSFRNEVIHKGKIPTKAEAFSYGEAILESIHLVLLGLKKDEPDHVNAAVGRHVRDVRKMTEINENIQFLSIPTTLSISLAHTEPQRTLSETIAMYTRQRARSGW